tara:strand:- start:2092 stop:3051 length:960 start_codon:yes stop_codon:yes gene_type:complete
MIQINNINDKAFEIIGFGKTEVKSKVYTCEVQGDKLMLRNANDRDDILVEFLDYTLYTIDSVTFASIDLLQAALVDVVFKSAPGGSGAVWGEITGTLSTQTDVQSALNDKQEELLSGVNIKTVGGTTVLGSGDIPIDSDFTSLNDTPESYTGSGGYAVKVNAGATGLEFVDGGGGGSQTFGFNFAANHGTNNTAFYYLFRNKSNGGMVGQTGTATQWNPFYYVDLAMPASCFLKNFTIRSVSSTWVSGLQIRMKIFKNKTTLEYDGNFVNSSGSGETGQITFNLTSSDTSFSEGDFIGIGFNCTGAMGTIIATSLFELT